MTLASPGGSALPDEDASIALSTGGYDSFVLRVFSRARDGRRVVHGEVTHIATHRTHHFTELHAAVDFILAQVGQRPPVLDVIEHD